MGAGSDLERIAAQVQQHVGRLMVPKPPEFPCFDLPAFRLRLSTQNKYSRFCVFAILSKTVQKSKSYDDFKTRLFLFADVGLV